MEPLGLEAEHLYQGGTDTTIESAEAGLASSATRGLGGSAFRDLRLIALGA